MSGAIVATRQVQTSESGTLEMVGPLAPELSAKEVGRLRVLQLVLERRLTRVQAGIALGLSTRQVTRLCRALQREGARGLVSRKRGRVGNRKLPAEIEAQVVGVARRFAGHVGPTLVKRMLAEQNGIKLAKETVRTILSKAGLWSPKSKTIKDGSESSPAT